MTERRKSEKGHKRIAPATRNRKKKKEMHTPTKIQHHKEQNKQKTHR